MSNKFSSEEMPLTTKGPGWHTLGKCPQRLSARSGLLCVNTYMPRPTSYPREKKGEFKHRMTKRYAKVTQGVGVVTELRSLKCELSEVKYTDGWSGHFCNPLMHLCLFLSPLKKLVPSIVKLWKCSTLKLSSLSSLPHGKTSLLTIISTRQRVE